MNRGKRRNLIPVAYADLAAWPCPDVEVLPKELRDDYKMRRRAVEMYAAGTTYVDIWKETGKGNDEVERLVKRCIKADRGGQIFGFYALIHGQRLDDYVRTAEVRRLRGSGKGGCAGALGQLFRRYPDVRALVEDRYFGQCGPNGVPETGTPIKSIHDEFKSALVKLGFTQYDWPFNTESVGYQALWTYCNALRQRDSQRAARPRAGEEAARRGAVGKGIPSLMPTLRPFSFVQLDFHKVDAASIIVITNDFGVELEVPVARWHIGFLVEEFSNAVIGAHVVLELTPSGDSTLEIVESALRPQEGRPNDPRYRYTPDGKVILSELMPELQYQCFSALKVDNAWSNAAHDVVNNIMDTVGCAINFGPVKAWARRNLIEQIFGKLTARGLKRLPSTFGSGPGDFRKTDPNGNAIKFRILLSELVSIIYGCTRDHNVENNEGLQWGAPVATMKAAVERPASGFFKQPLPLLTQQSMWLMMHIEEVTVRGNLSKNERPYFVLDRCVYTNETLANSSWLIGEKLIAYTDRRKCRIVYATVKANGVRLGLMKASGRWAESNCSWRDRKLINKAGLAARYHTEHSDPMVQFREEKTEQLATRKKAQRKKSSKTALDVARLAMRELVDPVEGATSSQLSKSNDGKTGASAGNYTPHKPEGAEQKPPSGPKTSSLPPVAKEGPVVAVLPQQARIESKPEASRPKPDPFGLDEVPLFSSVRRSD